MRKDPASLELISPIKLVHIEPLVNCWGEQQFISKFFSFSNGRTLNMFVTHKGNITFSPLLPLVWGLFNNPFMYLSSEQGFCVPEGKLSSTRSWGPVKYKGPTLLLLNQNGINEAGKASIIQWEKYTFNRRHAEMCKLDIRVCRVRPLNLFSTSESVWVWNNQMFIDHSWTSPLQNPLMHQKKTLKSWRDGSTESKQHSYKTFWSAETLFEVCSSLIDRHHSLNLIKPSDRSILLVAFDPSASSADAVCTSSHFEFDIFKSSLSFLRTLRT